jgi:hypothetical protein
VSTRGGVQKRHSSKKTFKFPFHQLSSAFISHIARRKLLSSPFISFHQLSSAFINYTARGRLSSSPSIP